VAKYGADEVLSLAQAMRRPETATDVATLLEQVAAVVRERPAKPTKKRERKRGAPRRDARVGTAEIRGPGGASTGELEQLADAIVSKPAKDPR
jgi:hypothetical protein